MKQSNTLHTQCRHIEHLYKGVWFKKKNTYLQNDSNGNLPVFNRGYACALMVHTQADQVLPQLLMQQFDSLLSHYMHIGHFHEEIC